MSETQILSLGPFLALARDLAALLAPIHPRPEFKEALESGLVTAARQQYARNMLKIPDPVASWSSAGIMPEPRGLVAGDRERRWVIGAAAIGSAVSVAGLAAYLWHQRGQRAA